MCSCSGTWPSVCALSSITHSALESPRFICDASGFVILRLGRNSLTCASACFCRTQSSSPGSVNGFCASGPRRTVYCLVMAMPPGELAASEFVSASVVVVDISAGTPGAGPLLTSFRIVLNVLPFDDGKLCWLRVRKDLASTGRGTATRCTVCCTTSLGLSGSGKLLSVSLRERRVLTIVTDGLRGESRGSRGFPAAISHVRAI